MPGGRFNQLVYSYQSKNSNIPSTFTIVHMEMWNVQLALGLWGHMCQRNQIFVKCDNQAVVSVINTWVTRESGLAALSRDILFETALGHMKLKVVNIKGKESCCVDSLARWHMIDINTARLSAIISNPV